jgi:hypothetical protein
MISDARPDAGFLGGYLKITGPNRFRGKHK